MSSLIAWGRGVLCGTGRGTRLGGHSERHQLPPYHNSHPKTLITPRGCWHIWGLQMGDPCPALSADANIWPCWHSHRANSPQQHREGTGNEHPQAQDTGCACREGDLRNCHHWVLGKLEVTGAPAGAACSPPNLCPHCTPKHIPSSLFPRAPHFWWGVFSG